MMENVTPPSRNPILKSGRGRRELSMTSSFYEDPKLEPKYLAYRKRKYALREEAGTMKTDRATEFLVQLKEYENYIETRNSPLYISRNANLSSKFSNTLHNL